MPSYPTNGNRSKPGQVYHLTIREKRNISRIRDEFALNMKAVNAQVGRKLFEDETAMEVFSHFTTNKKYNRE